MRVPIPCAAQIARLVRLVREASPIRLIVEVVTIFQVVISELSFVLHWARLLRAKHQGIISLRQIRVLIRHFRGRLLVGLVVAHAV